MKEKKIVLRGDVFGDDTAYAAGAIRFAFDLTPRSWDRLCRARRALLALNRDCDLDLCSVTSIAPADKCDIYRGRRSNPCRQVECLELVVMQECFYWQFGLGDLSVYQTEEVAFADAEALTRLWGRE